MNSREKCEPAVYDANQFSKDERILFLEAKVNFLLDEVSSMRTLLRHLVAEKINVLPLFQQTRDSFNWQWECLPEGHAMLSNEEWKKGVTETICTLSDLPAEWFREKVVMDAGCGQGRWTYGFGKLNVAACVSVDISDTGIATTRRVAEEFGDTFSVVQKNLLDKPDFTPSLFDLVWCFGVLHHTGNTFKGFQNLAECVKPGGYLFLMLYGEPRPNELGAYQYYHDIFDMRCRTRNLPFGEKVQRIEDKYGKEHLHGYFDAISPEINDLYRWDEIVGWLVNAGFEDIKRTLPNHPNHHVVARKIIK